MLVRSVARQIVGNFNLQAKSPLCITKCYRATDAVQKRLNFSDQIVYINGIARDFANTSHNWSSLKENILSMKGSVNSNNINAVILKSLLATHNIETAKSLVGHLLKSEEHLSVGTTNHMLMFYYHLAKERKLTENEIDFIRRTNRSLHDKHNLLDSTSCESLVHALSVIGDWRECLEIMEEIKHTGVPTHSAYSNVISTLFDCDEKEEAMKLVNKSLADLRLPMDCVYKSWIEYIVRNKTDKEEILVEMEQLNKFLEDTLVKITKNVADLILDVYVSRLNWQGSHAQVSAQGKCHNCKAMLQRASVTPEEFSLLKSAFMNRVLVGNDVFIKSSPKELYTFLQYLKKAGPYDVVIDALNVVYAVQGATTREKCDFLNAVVSHFLDNGKTVFVLGRQHMLRWPKKQIGFVLDHTKYFFTNDLSEDDPFFLTAALFGGPNTNILSRDKLRGHRFLLNDSKLRSIFLRWQLEHQMTYNIRQRTIIHRHVHVPVIKKPINFTPYAQSTSGTWHLPYELKYSYNYSDLMNAPTLIPEHWLCLKQPIDE